MEKEPINIWGMPYCSLPNGKLCDACCNVKQVTNDPVWKNFEKTPNQDCKFMVRKNGNSEGCSIYGFGPVRCDNYHCSKESEQRNKLEIIKYALEEGLVNLDQAQEAIQRILGN